MTTATRAGVYVKLRAYPVTVFVSDEEVYAAIAKAPLTPPQRTWEMVVMNIAIGKRAKAYRDWHCKDES